MSICLRIGLLFSFLISSFCEARINFVHIPKTAGTTVNSLLSANFDPSEVYPSHLLMTQPHVFPTPKDALKYAFIHNLEKCKVVFGHIAYHFFRRYDPDFNQGFFFTVLRDPVERVISMYFYKIKERGPKFYHSPLDVPKNEMCKMLASRERLQGKELLASAKETLDRMDYIIFQDDFENGIKDLFKMLNLNLPENAIPVKNATEYPTMDEEKIQKIREANYLDVLLYEYAKKKYRNY